LKHENSNAVRDIGLLLMSLEAIKCVCTQEKSHAQSNKQASNKGEKGNKRSGTESTARVLKHGGAFTTHNTKDCHRNEKDDTEKAVFHAAKKGSKKPNLARQSFALLSKKLDKLEKVIKKQGAIGKKHS
jgi:hypothetical protein